MVWVPSNRQSSCQNDTVNRGLRSWTMLSGTPNRVTTFAKNNLATYLPESSLSPNLQGIKRVYFVKRSTTVRIALYPLQVGRCVIKLILYEQKR